MEDEKDKAASEQVVRCIKQLPAIPTCLSVCHWSLSPKLLNECLESELSEKSTNIEKEINNLDPILNRVAVGGRSLLQLSTVEYDRISCFYNISRINCVDIGWSRGSHTLGGLALNGSTHIYVGLKGRHWQISSRIRSHNVSGCRLEWLGNSANLFALGFQDGLVQLIDGEVLRECSGINTNYSEELCKPIWSTAVSPSPVRDMHSRYLNPDTWISNELLLAYDDGTISLVDFRTKFSQNSKTQTLSKGLSCLRWNPHDNNVFATGCRSGVQIWDIRMMDGLTPITNIKSQFVVGRVRWRPGFSTQIAFCCSAVDSNIHVYDLLDPIRPIRRFSRHSDVVRDFDWIETDAIVTCGADKKLILSTWEDATRPVNRTTASSCIYVPSTDIQKVTDKSKSSLQRIIFHLSHDFNKTKHSNSTLQMNNLLNEDSIEDLVEESNISNISKETNKNKMKIEELLKSLGSIFRLCSERNDLFNYPLYSICGFLPDVGLNAFPGDLSLILDQKCELERKLHNHELLSDENDWLKSISKLELFGITPSWDSIYANVKSVKVSYWYDKWGSKIFKNSNSFLYLNKVLLVSSGRGEISNTLLFNKKNLEELNYGDKVECVVDFFKSVFEIEILSDSRFERIKKDKKNLEEITKCIKEELQILIKKNNIVLSLIIICNLLLIIIPSDTKSYKNCRYLLLKWTYNFVNLLRKYNLFSLSLQVIKSCPVKEIRNLARENISESNFFCGGVKTKNSDSIQICRKIIKSNKYLIENEIRNDLNYCDECDNKRNICVICNEVVTGRWVCCPSCKHGGHPKHIFKWYTNNSQCPSGCGHVCL